jgi:hypothetical protein
VLPPVVDAPQSRSREAVAAPVRTSCIEQYLEVDEKRSCVTHTRVLQTGNVRSYRVESSQGGAVRSLRVDAAGEQILHAEMALDSGEAFACGAGHCPGISMGPYDSQGARSIVFEKARLSRAEDESVVVHGRLRTVPDDQLAASSCKGQVLLISQGPGTMHFCPDSGTGFDLDEHGGTTYRFTNHDGNTLSVSVSKAGALQAVELGKLACAVPSCSGVAITDRAFSFRGTTLIERGSDTNTAVLDGVVEMAPQ